MNKTTHMKYHILVMFPATCRNRSTEVLQDRPDLVHQMNQFRVKIENVCNLIIKKSFRIDENHHMLGVGIWMESGQDLYDFIIRQPEFNWEIVPEIATVNRLTGELKKWRLVYTPTGITID